MPCKPWQILQRRLLVLAGGMLLAGVLGVGAALGAGKPAPQTSGPVLHLGTTQETFPVLPFALEFEDPTAKLTLAQVQSPDIQARFQRITTTNLAHGFTNSYFWYRLTVANPTPRTDWLLRVGENFLNKVHLFTPEGTGAWHETITGDAFPSNLKPYPHHEFVFSLHIPTGEQRTYYLMVSGVEGIVLVADVNTPQALGLRQALEYGFFGAYAGILLVMGVFNLFLYLSLRDMNYLLYVGAIWFLGFFYFGTFGIFRLLVVPGWSTELVNQSLWTIYYFGLVFHLLFSYTFLEIKRLGLSWRVAYGILTGIALALIPGHMVLDEVTKGNISMLVGMGIMTINMTAAVYVLRKGYRPARFYLLAQSTFFVGSMALVLGILGVIHPSFMAIKGTLLGMTSEVMLFSLALGDRYKLLRDEKEAAQQESLNNLKENVTLREEIARRQAAEAQLTAAKEQAEAATRLKDKFVSLVAHDIRSPFSAFMMVGQAMEEEVDHPLSKHQKSLLDNLQRRALLFMRMVDDLLALNRLQTGRLTPQIRPFSIWECAEEVLLLKHLAQNKGITLKNEIPPDATRLGDRQLILEVVQNLVTNAIKFSRRGDVVTLYVPPENPHGLAVKDTGVGVDAEVLPHLFDPTVKTTLAGTQGEMGSGMGLPLCKEIMTAHGGDILVESHPGNTVFTLIFPQPQS